MKITDYLPVIGDSVRIHDLPVTPSINGVIGSLHYDRKGPTGYCKVLFSDQLGYVEIHKSKLEKIEA